LPSLVDRRYVETAMPYEDSKERRHEECSCPERRIEATDRLLRETVERLSRHHTTHPVGRAACDSPADLRPHMENGLRALADIEQRRDLTDQEHSWQRAFRMVLSTRA
jgi:hypothetical protein